MELGSGHRLAAAVAAAVVVIGGVMAGASVAGASPPPVLYVSDGGPNVVPGCTHAPYTTINEALTAARAGDTVYVCPGTYATQVTISTPDLTLTGAGASSVIDPTSASANASDLDTAQPFVAIVDVTPGTTGVTVSNLVEDGSGLTANFTWPGCADNFVGILYQRASGSIVGDTVEDVALPPTLRGCQAGDGIFVQTGNSGTARVTVSATTVTGYDKNGITCNDSGTTCTVRGDTVAGNGPTPSIAQNGVQIAFGALGSVVGNVVSGNESTDVTPTAVGTGVLVYGCAPALSAPMQVVSNVVKDNDIGISVVDVSAATCTKASATPTRNVIAGNFVSKTDGDTNRADETGFTSYQVGIVDEGNGDQITGNVITGTIVDGVDTAYGPKDTTGGPFLAPLTTSPSLNAHLLGNIFDGKLLTAPPSHGHFPFPIGGFGFFGPSF